MFRFGGFVTNGNITKGDISARANEILVVCTSWLLASRDSARSSWRHYTNTPHVTTFSIPDAREAPADGRPSFAAEYRYTVAFTGGTPGVWCVFTLLVRTY